MYNFCDISDINEFKKLLKRARNEAGITQAKFIERLHIESRTTVSNWESTKNGRVPDLIQFLEICKLLNVEPNYLLGVIDVDSKSTKAISESIGLSYQSTKKLMKGGMSCELTDSLLLSDLLLDITNCIQSICYYRYLHEAFETAYSDKLLSVIDSAFNRFYLEVFPLDQSHEKFASYLKQEKFINHIDDIDTFINDNLTENEINNLHYSYGDFFSLSSEEKYELLVKDISETVYDYKMSASSIELSKQRIAASLNRIIDEFIDNKVTAFKNRNNH